MNETGGFLDWKIGQTPNVLMLFIGYCCCCGFPLIFQMHAFRREFAKAFGVDDSAHWIAVIIGIYGLYLSNEQLTSLEAQKGITPASSMPWFLTLFVPILWPIAVADQMKRLNALAQQQ